MDAYVQALAGRTAVVLLAAGQATRFGAPKLHASLAGRPLAHHAAMTLADMPFAYKLCVSTQEGVDLSPLGFEMVMVDPGLPMSHSIRAGIAATTQRDVDAILIALADMPFVDREHISALMVGFDGTAVGSSHGGKAMPPALFGRPLFAALASLNGDSGAKMLLDAAPLIEAPAERLLDIDTPDDLHVAEMLGGKLTG